MRVVFKHRIRQSDSQTESGTVYALNLARIPGTQPQSPSNQPQIATTHHLADPTRRLVVVDIENLIGGAVLHPNEAAWARRRLVGAGVLAESDQVVIGTSHLGLLPIGMAWTGQRYVIGSGPDGADLALLEVLDENLPAKYGEVVLASGDGIFTDAAAALCAAGVRVHVVAVRNRLSRRLRMAATKITLLDQPYRAEALRASA